MFGHRIAFSSETVKALLVSSHRVWQGLGLLRTLPFRSSSVVAFGWTLALWKSPLGEAKIPLRYPGMSGRLRAYHRSFEFAPQQAANSVIFIYFVFPCVGKSIA